MVDVQTLQDTFHKELELKTKGPEQLAREMIQLAQSQPASLNALIKALTRDRAKGYPKPNPDPNTNNTNTNQDQNESGLKSARLIHCLKIVAIQQQIATANEQAVAGSENEEDPVSKNAQQAKARQSQEEEEFKLPEEDSPFLKALKEELEDDDKNKALADKFDDELDNHQIYNKGKSSRQKSNEELGVVEVEFGPGDPVYKIAQAMEAYFLQTKGPVDRDKREKERRETDALYDKVHGEGAAAASYKKMGIPRPRPPGA